MTEVVIAPAAKLREAFCRRFETTARDAIAARGQFACALSGGSVAETFLPALEGAAVDWSRVHVFWGGGRAVPPGDAQSNFGGARHTLEQLDVDAAHVHRIRGEDPD